MSLIQPYNNDWADAFKRIRQLLLDTLLGLNVRIEHVGSTAVQGLAAKPIIDIDIVYNSSVNFEAVSNLLYTLGYIHVGDQGIRDREVFKRLEQHHPVLDTNLHHLYVCPSDSEEFKRHLIFRDHLGDHPEARMEYERMKRILADEANQDKKLYASLKEINAREFIESIMLENKSC